MLIYRAFWELNSERSSGWGEGFIPFQALAAYCRESGYFPVMEVLPYIRAMDAAYLKHRREKSEAEKNERDQRSTNRARISGNR